MNVKKALQEIQDNIQLVINQQDEIGKTLLATLSELHPADIADFLAQVNREYAQKLFLLLPKKLQWEIFEEFSDAMKVFVLSFLPEHEKVEALHSLSIDELTDLFDLFSDDELKIYLNLLHKRAREKVLSLLQFDPESAGGIMDTEIITFMEDFTVEKSVKLLQRLRPRRDIHQQIYVISREQMLIGHINLEDLLLHTPQERIKSLIQKNELVVNANEDRETVAKKMVHYGLMIVPVVDDENHFLGVIPGDTLVDVILEEASEDVSKMAALAPLRYSYFETSFVRLFFQRGYILIILLLAESISGTILRTYETMLIGFMVYFIPMLISAGGNTSSQTSAMVIQGIASGQLDSSNMLRFLRREAVMALSLASALGITAFIRVYWTINELWESVVVSIALALIVLVSALLGSCIPWILKRFNIDPAFSAGPFLATLMDILGILIYCYISKLLLF